MVCPSMLIPVRRWPTRYLLVASVRGSIRMTVPAASFVTHSAPSPKEMFPVWDGVVIVSSTRQWVVSFQIPASFAARGLHPPAATQQIHGPIRVDQAIALVRGSIFVSVPRSLAGHPYCPLAKGDYVRVCHRQAGLDLAAGGVDPRDPREPLRDPDRSRADRDASPDAGLGQAAGGQPDTRDVTVLGADPQQRLRIRVRDPHRSLTHGDIACVDTHRDRTGEMAGPPVDL